MTKYLIVKLHIILLILKDFSLKVQVACNDHLSHDPMTFVLCHQNFAWKMLQFWIYSPIQILFRGEIPSLPLLNSLGVVHNAIMLQWPLSWHVAFFMSLFLCLSTLNLNIRVISKSSPWPRHTHLMPNIWKWVQGPTCALKLELYIHHLCII